MATEPKTPEGRHLKVLSKHRDEASYRAQLSDNELLDQAVDIYARYLIAEKVDYLLGLTSWMQHGSMPEVNWRRVRDRIAYIAGEHRPTEEQATDAHRHLTYPDAR